MLDLGAATNQCFSFFFLNEGEGPNWISVPRGGGGCLALLKKSDIWLRFNPAQQCLDPLVCPCLRMYYPHSHTRKYVYDSVMTEWCVEVEAMPDVCLQPSCQVNTQWWRSCLHWSPRCKLICSLSCPQMTQGLVQGGSTPTFLHTANVPQQGTVGYIQQQSQTQQVPQAQQQQAQQQAQQQQRQYQHSQNQSSNVSDFRNMLTR